MRNDHEAYHYDEGKENEREYQDMANKKILGAMTDVAVKAGDLPRRLYAFKGKTEARG